METAIIIVIVAISLAYLVRKAWKTVFRQPESTCGCGCSGCSSEVQETCTDLSKTLSECNSK